MIQPSKIAEISARVGSAPAMYYIFLVIINTLTDAIALFCDTCNK